jgi:hypothetical protein
MKYFILKIKMYIILILSVVLHEFETWTHTMRLFENRMLRGIFGPKREEIGRLEKTA